MFHYNKLALAIGLTTLLAGCNQTTDSAPEQTQTQRPIQVVELSKAKVSETKRFSGIVKPSELSDLRFRVPGTIEKIFVKQGEQVEKGQVIAQLDPHDYQVALEELEARMLEAQSAHKLAKAELSRVRQATEDNAIANVNLDRAISGYERSLSAIKVVEKNIQRAEDALRYTKLKAPFSGIIASVNFEAYEQALPGIAVATLHAQDTMEVTIDVPSNLINQFELQQKAKISWHQSQQHISGDVIEIAPQPHPIKQTYSVTYRLHENTDALFAGKAVSLVAQMPQQDSTYCIPYSAIYGKAEQTAVNVVRDHQITAIPVDVVSLSSLSTCVMGDLNVDDKVVVSGTQNMKTGMAATHLTTRKI